MARTNRCKSGKRQYHDRDHAKKVITNARQRVKDGHQEVHLIPERAYLCPDCHRWHVTSQVKRSALPPEARRLAIESLAVSTEAPPSEFAAGWNRPGLPPEPDPKVFDSITEAAAYIRAELARLYASEPVVGGVRFFTAEKALEAIESLDKLTGDEVRWSSGVALAGWVYWIMPVTTAE